MYSQIGQVTPGQTSNQILATAGKDTGSRDSSNARDQETFQSVLAGGDRSARPDRPHPRKAQEADSEARRADSAAEAEAESAVPPGDEVTDSDEDAALAFLSPDADEIVFKKGRPNPAPTPDEIAQLAARAAKAIDAAEAAEKASTSPDAEDTPGTRQAKDVPAWFATARGAGQVAGAPAGSAAATHAAADRVAGEEQAAKIAGRVLPHDMAQAGKSTAVAQALDVAADERAQRRESTPGMIVSSAVHRASQNAVGADGGTAATSGDQQATDPTDDSRHAPERRVDAENPTPAFATRRNPVVSNPGQATVMQLRSVTGPNMQETPGEKSGIRWLTEVGFTSELAAQDMPATSRAHQTALLQQPELPRNIAVQIAQAMRHGGTEKPMELVLSPAELGRVRISMQALDGAMTVHVVAERPETLDLMRRHIDLLAQEFHDIGFGTAEFAFGQNQAEGDGHSEGQTGTTGLMAEDLIGAADDTETSAALSTLTIQSDRVDIRL
ncbi:flagellar hook-length control protein FliK [Roseovarius sp. CAU 1744]|uniref:flagellar hook-length control protein FliK n=1 Tax=Roseovarius sp. CAU 1744 TaxID=3140368 RepID=UPI00325B2C4F